MIKENRLQMYAKLEKHIMEARAKALAFEERDEARRHQVCDEPDAYGIPPSTQIASTNVIYRNIIITLNLFNS
jgi:hypothetical protein